MGGDRELFDLLEPTVASQGVDLVELRRVRAGRRTILRVVIHSAQGISHGDCARVTRLVEEVLEERGTPPGTYELEVSSPGIDRVLREAREFEVFRGRPVRIWLDEASPEREITGVCEGLRGDGAVVVRREDGAESVVDWLRVKKARLVPPEEPRRRIRR
jgi:ribosome maturation factor RimP